MRTSHSLHRAVLSAHQVRQEYAIFLFELWEEIWTPALNHAELGKNSLEALSVGESCGKRPCDAKAVWDGWKFARYFTLPGKAEPFGVGTRADFNSAKLWIDAGSSEAIGDVGESWQPEATGFEANSVGVEWSVEGHLNLDKLHEAAAGAVAAIRSGPA